MKRSIFGALLAAVLITFSGCCFFQRLFTGYGCGPATDYCGGCANSGLGHQYCGRWGSSGVHWGAWGASREPCDRSGNWVGSSKYLPGNYPVESPWQGNSPTPIGPSLAPEETIEYRTRYVPRGFPVSSGDIPVVMPSYRVRGTAPGQSVAAPDAWIGKVAPDAWTANETEVEVKLQ